MTLPFLTCLLVLLVQDAYIVFHFWILAETGKKRSEVKQQLPYLVLVTILLMRNTSNNKKIIYAVLG